MARLPLLYALASLLLFPGCDRREEGPAPDTRATESPQPEPAVTAPPATAPNVDAGTVEVQLESTYRKPAIEVVEIVDAKPTPNVSLSPDEKRMLLMSYPSLPGIELLSEPILRLAGERINPVRNATQRTLYYDALTLVTIEGAAKLEVDLAGRQAVDLQWSPDSQHLAFLSPSDSGMELWVADVTLGKPARVGDFHVNDTFDGAVTWQPDSKGLLVRTVLSPRRARPVAAPVPPGPTITQPSGREATNRTYQDLLTNRVDEAQFEHHFTSQLMQVGLDGTHRPLGQPAIISQHEASPDGKWLLVRRLVGPWSYAVPWWRFGHKLEVWPSQGGDPIVLASNELAEEVPIEGVITGPRSMQWQPLEAATLVWAEALDGGDPRQEASQRDKLMRSAAPFSADPREFDRTEHRFYGLDWLELEGEYMLTDYDRDRRWLRTRLRDIAHPDLDKTVFDRSSQDRYGDPGRPVYRQLDDGHAVVRVDGGEIFLSGSGATPKGDRPFLDSMSLETLETRRLFHAPEDAYASFYGFHASTKSFVIRRESPQTPPNYFVRGAEGNETALTDFPHPYPQLEGIEKRLLTYTRKDGVPLSGTLYLPPDRKPDEKLPLVIWAYPREYNDKGTAGQVRAAPTRFTYLRATSPLMFVTQGYAVLDGAQMPIIGDPEKMNDRFLPQLVQSAEAAIDAVVELGVADRDRVGIAGHSYGAFMTANLLAHSDLFRAGIARSGAYNRSLTPFGFQSERRTLWEATDTYVKVSPLFNAATLNEPLLMIHGEIDNNSGTFPIQSKRLFHALKGLGGVAKLVLLPNESHGYRARESVLHVLAESFEWFEEHVKTPKAKPDAI